MTSLHELPIPSPRDNPMSNATETEAVSVTLIRLIASDDVTSSHRDNPVCYVTIL
jgi:hypothetical protein